MTVPISELLARAPNVLLDFDGPVCAIFSGITDRVVADQLQTLIGVSLTRPGATDDPFDVLRAAAEVGPDVARRANDELTKLEIAATATAQPTPGIDVALSRLCASGHTITIVSNNSEAAVRRYMDLHGLSRWISDVSARTASTDSTHLKPHPHLLFRAVAQLAAHPGSCVMIGDSVSDVEAAHAADVVVIAYANHLGKRVLLAAAKPDAIIHHVDELAAAAAVR